MAVSPPFRNMRGFSTLEMLIAMTILMLAISAVLLLVPLTAGSAIDTELGQIALERAGVLLAQERANAAYDFTLVIATSSLETIEGIPFHERIEVEYIPHFAKKVTAHVAWGAGYGRTQEVALSTLVTDFERTVGGSTCNSSLEENWLFPLTFHYLFGELLGDPSGEYPLTDIDVYRDRLYATADLHASPLPEAGPQEAGSVIDDASRGSVAFMNATDAAGSDNSYATALLSGNEATHYLRATKFGFHIPAGATIIGIQADVERKSSSNTNTVKDSSVRMVRADGSLGDLDKALTTNWGTSDVHRTYGSSADVWNESGWSASAINDDDFGLAFAAAASGGTGMRTASIDSLRLTITYTKQFYIVRVSGTPTLIEGLGQNTIAGGMNAVTVATSTSTGDHAYVAMDSIAAQLEALDITPGLVPRVIAAYRVPGASAVANAIAYQDGYIYLGLANNPIGGEFVVIDVHHPESPMMVGMYEIGAGVNAITLLQGRAYLATDDTSRELIILDLGDVAHPSLLAFYNAPGTTGSGQGRALFTRGNTQYLGRYYSLTTAPEFLALDTASTPFLLGSYDIGPSSALPFGIYGIVVRGQRAFLLTSSLAQGGKLQVLDVSDMAHPTLGASVTLPHGGGGVALDCETDTLYAASVPASGAYARKGSLSVSTSL
jgi:hypothetical protein